MFWNFSSTFGGGPSVRVLHTLLSFEVFGGSEDGGWNFDSWIAMYTWESDEIVDTDSPRSKECFYVSSVSLWVLHGPAGYILCKAGEDRSIEYFVCGFPISTSRDGNFRESFDCFKNWFETFSLYFSPEKFGGEFSKKLQAFVCFFVGSMIFSSYCRSLFQNIFPNSLRSSFSVTGGCVASPPFATPCCRSYLCWFQPFGCWSHRESVSA